MPRKGATPKREVLPDPKYGSRVVTKFVNQMMYDGKKSVAETIFYDAIEELGKRTDSEPLRAFEQLIEKGKAADGSEIPSRRWRYLPGSHGSPPRKTGSLGYPLAGQLCPFSWRERHGFAFGG
jgi:SSU ribosomal protein S7P